MDRYKAPRNFIQYQLWQDCSNNCLFCSEKNPYKSDKIENMNYIMHLLDLPEVQNYEEVGIIGGEIFDYQLNDDGVRNTFYCLLNKICNMHFEKIYIATNLIYNMDKYLVPCLQYLRQLNIQNKILICTSYDTKWRFNTEEKFEVWSNNMLRLKKEYADFNTHIEIILTGDFIDKVLSGNFNVAQFSNYYKSRIDFIEPASGMYYADKYELQQICPNFFPTKSKFLEFLTQECIETKNIDITCLISYQIRASRIYHLDQGKYVCYKDRRQPGFRVKCLDETRKYDLGFIDSEDSMEDICTLLCDMVSD